MPDEKVQRILQSIVVTCLGGPAGDPDSSHRRAAALAVVLMELTGGGFDEDAIEMLGDYYTEARKEWLGA